MVQASVSQSVERAIHILDLFEAERRPLTRAEICQALDAPRSSMAALLHAMTELGVLSLDRRTSTYFPTARLGRLARWIDQVFSLDEAIADMMKRMQSETLETVTLSTPLHNIIEVVHHEPGLNLISYVTQVGQVLPLWGSAVGNAYLSTITDKAIADMFRKAQTMRARWPLPSSIDPVMAGVQATRRNGYSLVVGSVSSDAAAIAMPLREDSSSKPLVIALAGPSDRIARNEADLVRLMRHEVARLEDRLGPPRPLPAVARAG